ncbi:MAG: hypothetical protein LBU84_02545 [Prevotella sp.]|jgi:hypothetical protein|nr:hypothetical protein [Prevotella sp.]
MAKYTKKLTEEIVSLIEEDTYSIKEICSNLKISRKSFYEWKEAKPEFKKAIDRAVERRDEKLMMTARRSLKKKLEGYTLTETRTTYVPDKNNPEKLVLKSQVIKQKEYAPDMHAIKLILSQGDRADDSKEKNRSSALTIIVQDPKAASQLNQLREDLMSGNLKERKEERETGSAPGQSQEIAPATDKQVVRPEPKKEEKPVRVRDYSLPSGYLYRG